MCNGSCCKEILSLGEPPLMIYKGGFVHEERINEGKRVDHGVETGEKNKEINHDIKEQDKLNNGDSSSLSTSSFFFSSSSSSSSSVMFPNSYPLEFYKEVIPDDKYGLLSKLPSQISFESWMDENVTKCCLNLGESQSIQSLEEWKEIKTTLRSDSRNLEWCLMIVPKNRHFQVHAHPVMEIIYVLKGALHEIRMDGCVNVKGHVRGDKGPNLKKGVTLRQTKNEEKGEEEETTTNVSLSQSLEDELQVVEMNFNRKVMEEGKWYINEIGSVHQSFTMDDYDETVLLVIWGGYHLINILPEHIPPGKGFVNLETSENI